PLRPAAPPRPDTPLPARGRARPGAAAVRHGQFVPARRRRRMALSRRTRLRVGGHDPAHLRALRARRARRIAPPRRAAGGGGLAAAARGARRAGPPPARGAVAARVLDRAVRAAALPVPRLPAVPRLGVGAGAAVRQPARDRRRVRPAQPRRRAAEPRGAEARAAPRPAAAVLGDAAPALREP